MVFRTDHINRKFTHKAKVTSNIPHNVTKKMGTPKTPIQKPKVETYKPKQSRAIKISHINYGPFEKVIPLGLDDEQTLTSSSPPTNLKQAVNDDRLVNKPSWTDKLFAAIPSVQFPKAYAENIDTQGNLDAENEKLIPTLDPNLAADRFVDPAGIYDPYTTVASPPSQEILPSLNQFILLDSHSDSSIFTPITPNPDSPLKIKDSLPISEMPWGHQADTVTDDGKFATMPQGATKFTIPDYIKNEKKSQYYKLEKNVSPEKHLGALNTQSLYKFENEVQSQWQGLVSNPSLLDSTSFRALENKINDSNIPRNDKIRLIEEYKKKKKNYQMATGGYGTDTPWSFGTISPKNPNKAETIKLKLLSGEKVSAKEMKQYAILTGTPLGSTLKKADPNFGGYEQFL